MRLDGWPAFLHAEIAAARLRPFTPETACCLFFADCARAITGVDPAATFRGQYATVEEGLELLRERGGIVRVMRELFGPPIPVQRATRGDAVALRSDLYIDGRTAGMALGVCIGHRAVFRSLGHALARVRLDHCAVAWRVR